MGTTVLKNAAQEPEIVDLAATRSPDLIVTVFERLGMEAQARAVRARNRESSAYRDPVDPWADQLATAFARILALPAPT